MAWERFPRAVAWERFPHTVAWERFPHTQWLINLKKYDDLIELFRHQTSKPGDELINLKKYDDLIDLESHTQWLGNVSPAQLLGNAEITEKKDDYEQFEFRGEGVRHGVA